MVCRASVAHWIEEDVLAMGLASASAARFVPLCGVVLSERGSWRRGLGGRKYRGRSCPKPRRRGGAGTLHGMLMPARSFL